MGILRIYLALCVVAVHSADTIVPWAIHDARQAVQGVYIISGFFMAMILTQRYHSPKTFYITRAIRICPVYYTVLASALIVSIAAGVLLHRWLSLTPFFKALKHNELPGVLLAALSNVTLIGQDWIFFLSQDRGEFLHFTGNFWNDKSPLCQFLVLPQCWSIAVELTFYAVAFWFSRLSSLKLGFVAFGGFGIRAICHWCLGLTHDPWDYRLFPFEMPLFLFGMLGYRLWARFESFSWSTRFQCRSKTSYAFLAILLLVSLSLHA